MADGNADWAVYRLQVLADLKRINKNVEKLAESDTEIRIAVGKLQLCAAMTGATAGVISGIVGTIIVTMILNSIW